MSELDVDSRNERCDDEIVGRVRLRANVHEDVAEQQQQRHDHGEEREADPDVEPHMQLPSKPARCRARIERFDRHELAMPSKRRVESRCVALRTSNPIA